MAPLKVTVPVVVYPILLGLLLVVTPYTGSPFTIGDIGWRILYMAYVLILIYVLVVCSKTRTFHTLVRRLCKVCPPPRVLDRLGRLKVMSGLRNSLQNLSMRPVATPMRRDGAADLDVEEGSPVCMSSMNKYPTATSLSTSEPSYARQDSQKRTSLSSNSSLPPRVGAPMKMKHSTYVKLDNELGRGASKTVWLALDLGSQQKVAWGVVHLAHTSKKEHDRAVSELALLMSHSPYRQKVEKKRFEKNSLEEGQKYLVRLLDMVSTETHLHIITELIKGGNFRRWSQTAGFYPDGRPCTAKDATNLMKVVTDISHGLAWLHHRNIIHRDVRPENILINTDSSASRIENAVLADMGLFAFSPSVLSEKISIAGRDEYLAPEIVKQMVFDDTAMGIFDVTFTANYSDKVDVWMLGLSIAEIPSNRLPCVNIHRCNSFEQYTEALAQRIREYTDNLNLGDNELVNFFDNALRINPETRWSSVMCWKTGGGLGETDSRGSHRTSRMTDVSLPF